MKFNGLRFTNGILLVLVLVLTLTGLFGLYWTTSDAAFTLHRISGWGLLAVLPWKAAIVFRSLRRKIHGTQHPWRLVVSILLALLTLIVLALGLLWSGRFGPADYPLRQTAISWHWMLALGLLLPFLLHVWKRWPNPRPVDLFSRRGFLRAAAAVPLAALGYFGYQWIARTREHPQQPARFTGSRRAGWFSGNDFPLTHNTAPSPEQIAPENWRLDVTGAVAQPARFNYAVLGLLLVSQLEATIDCTLGWYARQSWSGVTLPDLLAHAGLSRAPAGIWLVSVTGYMHYLPWIEAKDVLLATHVGGEVLSSGHGFPLRAVVPSRRGWFWVKWLAEIKVVR